MSAPSPFLQRLHSDDRPAIVFDGAMGTNLQVQNLTADATEEILIID